MTISIDTIRQQYKHRRHKELNSEQQLINFVRSAVGDNILSDYDARRRKLISDCIDIGVKLKAVQIAKDTELNLDQMQKLSFVHAAKDKGALETALEDAKNYATCCSIAQECRNRGLQDLADKASLRAEMVGPKGYLSNQEYRAMAKEINRAVVFAASENFVVRDVDNLLAIPQPTLIPIGDLVLSAIAGDDLPDAFDKKIADIVSKDLSLPPAMSAAQLKALRTLTE